MFNFWNTKNLIDEDDCDWMFATFAWALTHFDRQDFFQRTQLIQPTDAFFPGKINNPATMAETVFNATIQHCGLQHWPIKLQHTMTAETQNYPIFSRADSLFQRSSCKKVTSITNASSSVSAIELPENQSIKISYNPQQTTQPGDLAASFSHMLAQHLLAQSQLQPVGGPELFAQSTEILAVVMGFGVMLSNSAYAFRGSCARCFNPNAHRQASLSEDKVVFALALFCQLKAIPQKQATQYLKPYLRSMYKQAIKQIKQHPDKLAALLSLNKR